MAGFLASIFQQRASIENPRFNINDPQAVEALLGGEPSASGVRVNPQAALTYSPWWRGINLIARDVGKLPLCVYSAAGDGKDKDPRHPAYRLLRHQPNEFQTALAFRMQLTAHAVSRGNGYAYIFRRGDATPAELLPLDPAETYPVRANGVVRYVTTVGGKQAKLDAADVLHLKGLGDDGLCGYSVITLARESLGLGMGAARYQSISLKRGARPSVILEVPGTLDEPTKAALRAAWERMHAGLDNAHRTAILDRGMKANPISLSSEDAQVLQTRQFQIREVANWLNVPPHKLGDTSRAGYASLEQENQSYLDECLDFWLAVWESECWAKLLTEEEKDAESHVIEFVRAAMLRADLSARANFYRTATGGRPWMTPDEVRARENMNPLGGDAAELLTPLNMGQGGPANDPKQPGAGGQGAKGADAGEGDGGQSPPDQAGADEAQRAAMREAARAILADAVGRMTRRVATHAERAAKNPRGFTAWVEAIDAEHRATFAAALTPVEQACRAAGGTHEDLAGWLLGRLRHTYGRAADSQTSRGLAGFLADANPALEGAFVREAVERFLGDASNGT
jgi:HK97 family phage portal protein